FVGPQQLGIDFVETLGAISLALRCRVVADFLEVHWRKMHVRPLRRRHFQPFAVSGKTPLQQEFRLFLDRRKLAYRFFGQPRRQRDGFNIRHEPSRVFSVQEGVNWVGYATAHSEKLHVEGHAADLFGGALWALLRPGMNWIVAVGFTMSATDTCSSVLRTAALMRCQLLRILQAASTLHAPGVAVHSVSPKGWSSSASIMSAILMSSGARPRA